MIIKKIYFLLLVLPLFLVSCAKDFQAQRVETTDDEMIDDSWNDSDARMVAEKMINEMLTQEWYKEFLSKNKGKKPVVFVSQVDNRTDEPYLDVKALTNEVRSELIKSRKIKFIDKEARSNVNEEMEYQHGGNVSASTAKKLGEQTGADFLLAGDISVSIQTADKRKIKAYQVTLRLTNLESTEIDWENNHKIKKKFKY